MSEPFESCDQEVSQQLPELGVCVIVDDRAPHYTIKEAENVMRTFFQYPDRIQITNLHFSG